MPDRVKSFREIDSRQDRPRTWPGFVKPTRNGLRKVQYLIKCRRPGRKPTWRGERMKLDSRKKSRRDRMMRSNSFDTHEMREISRKEAGESKSFSHLVYGNNGRCIPDGRKGMQRPGEIEDVKKKIHARARKVL